jgi:hypothetical protein
LQHVNLDPLNLDNDAASVPLAPPTDISLPQRITLPVASAINFDFRANEFLPLSLSRVRPSAGRRAAGRSPGLGCGVPLWRFWGFSLMRLATVVRFVIGAAVLSLCLNGPATADETKDKAKSDKQPLVVQIDINKLPPDVAKRLLEIAGKGGDEKGTKGKGDEPAPEPKKKGETKKSAPKSSAKTISLTEAIAIAEKAGKGQAVKAERKGEGEETQFKVEVVGKGGEKSKIELSASGERRDAKEQPKESPTKKPGKKPGKGKGKGKDKDKDDDDED